MKLNVARVFTNEKTQIKLRTFENNDYLQKA